MPADIRWWGMDGGALCQGDKIISGGNVAQRHLKSISRPQDLTQFMTPYLHLNQRSSSAFNNTAFQGDSGLMHTIFPFLISVRKIRVEQTLPKQESAEVGGIWPGRRTKPKFHAPHTYMKYAYVMVLAL